MFHREFEFANLYVSYRFTHTFTFTFTLVHFLKHRSYNLPGIQEGGGGKKVMGKIKPSGTKHEKNEKNILSVPLISI